MAVAAAWINIVHALGCHYRPKNGPMLRIMHSIHCAHEHVDTVRPGKPVGRGQSRLVPSHQAISNQQSECVDVVAPITWRRAAPCVTFFVLAGDGG